MSTRLVFEGLAELRAQLRQLPEDMTKEASNLITGTANEASVVIRTGYGRHHVTGELQEGVVVERLEAGRFGAGLVVKSLSKLASIFENGTQARHNALGANRGAMPAAHVFVPAMMAARRKMYGLLKDMLVRYGFVVSGDV